jgi:glutaredoxin-dependent peroxiredoxin
LVLRIGQKTPEFALPDADNKTRSLNELVKEGPIILAFFSFAFSGVCDKEMCAFRDAFSNLQNVGRIVGVSVDSTYTLKAFAQTYNLPFPLLSDFNKKVSRLYGVLQDPWTVHGYKGVAKRSVFLIDARGFLRYRWITDTPSEEPPYSEVVRNVQKLAT